MMIGGDGASSAAKDIKVLIESSHPIIAVETDEEERVTDILARLAVALEVPLWTWTTIGGLTRPGGLGPAEDTRQPHAALAKMAASRANGIYLFKDLHRFLDNAAVVRRLRDLAPALAKSRRALVLVAPSFELPAEIRSIAIVVRLELPSVAELELLVRRVVADLARKNTVTVSATQSDLSDMARALCGLTLFDAERALTRAIVEDLSLGKADVDRLLELKRQVIERDGLLDFRPRIDDFTQVGGLANLKAWLSQRRGAFSDEGRAFGLEPPKGILLLGVQGCGKSLAAKAVAKEWALPLLKLEPGRLYDKYVGESEKNLERALALAERLAPVVLWIDELEKGFSNVSHSETDAGLSRRIFGRLLGWMQDRKAPVFIAATCNDIVSLPPEFVRKGRFDEIFFVDLPTAEERRDIFAIHVKRRRRDPSGFDLELLAAASEGFSGAEIEQAVVAGLYRAFAVKLDLTTDVIVRELASTKPLSVTRAEEVAGLREWAKERAVRAS